MYGFDSRVRYSEVDDKEKMTLASVLNYFQDCSTFHSEDLGVGMRYLNDTGRLWVLSYWQIDVERYPSVCEKIRISTFPYDFKGFLGCRNFLMEDEKGNRVAYANSIWSFLNRETGRPEKIPAELAEIYGMEEKLSMEYEPRKIELPAKGRAADAFQVKKYQIDSNHHVNNGQYVQMASEYLPKGSAICRMRAEYKKAALLHDTISPIIYEEDSRIVVSLNGEDGVYAVVEFK